MLTSSTQPFGLKVTSAQREYYRYTGISAEFGRYGVHSLPRPDFSRLPRTTRDREEDSPTKTDSGE